MRRDQTSHLQTQKAAPKASRPMRPNIKPPASSMPYTSGCRRLKTPTMWSDHVVMPAMASRQMRPGMSPRVSNVAGIDKTPRPICVFIMSATVPTHPTCPLVSFFSPREQLGRTCIAVVGPLFRQVAKHGIADACVAVGTQVLASHHRQVSRLALEARGLGLAGHFGQSTPDGWGSRERRWQPSLG